jgi:hypothetical protein
MFTRLSKVCETQSGKQYSSRILDISFLYRRPGVGVNGLLTNAACHVDFNHCAPSNSRALRRSSGSSSTIDRIKSRKSAFSETESCGFWQMRSRGNGGNVDGVKSLPKATVSSALCFPVNFLTFVIKEAIAVLRPCKQRFGHAAKYRFHLC